MCPTTSQIPYPELPPPPPAFVADRAEPTLPPLGRRFIAQLTWTKNLSCASRLRAAADHRALVLLDELRCERERRGEGRRPLTDRIEPPAEHQRLLLPELSPGWRVLERAARDGQNLEDFYAVRAGLEAAAEDGPDPIARAGVANLQRSRHFSAALAEAHEAGVSPRFTCLCGRAVTVRRRRTSGARYALVFRSGPPVLSSLFGTLPDVEEAPLAVWEPMSDGDARMREFEWCPVHKLNSPPRVLGTLECEGCCRRGAPPLCAHQDRFGDVEVPCDRHTTHGRLFCREHRSEEWKRERADGVLATTRGERPASEVLRPLWGYLLSGGSTRVELEADLRDEYQQEVATNEAAIRERLPPLVVASNEKLWELRQRFERELEVDFGLIATEGAKRTIGRIVNQLAQPQSS